MDLRWTATSPPLYFLTFFDETFLLRLLLRFLRTFISHLGSFMAIFFVFIFLPPGRVVPQTVLYFSPLAFQVFTSRCVMQSTPSPRRLFFTSTSPLTPIPSVRFLCERQPLVSSSSALSRCKICGSCPLMRTRWGEGNLNIKFMLIELPVTWLEITFKCSFIKLNRF